ncbi:MAG: ectoine/hydroxyectoine ABC transporter ATP-binding protein EhuA [Deltaproteobacteria bacterium]|nr:ectoine/hydroxyectoine ABC transporter ATP-binding protein EhuA [Deltaproteobacteria bacterium]
MIRFSKVTKRFGDLVVLEELDFEVMAKERLVLIGSSGSGKSTILRILMTLEKPDSGFIEVEGESLWHMEKKGRIVPATEKHLRKMRKKIGMVFQHFHLFPHMTVLRNVTEAQIYVLGMSKEEARERALALLDMVGLSEKADQYPAQLSGGQKQRVAIARALAQRPQILLFDEVTSALDPELVGEVLKVLKDLAQEHEHTMLIVTHEMGFAREIADRICFLDKGRIIEKGPPSRIFTEPEMERTREFLRNYIEVSNAINGV